MTASDVFIDAPTVYEPTDISNLPIGDIAAFLADNTDPVVDNDINSTASDRLRSRPPSNEIPGPIPADATWVRQAFIVTTAKEGYIAGLSDQDKRNRRFSSASLKYTDSSIGGNTIINPPPQFTRYADIRDKGIRAGAVKTSLSETKGDIGMGRYYSEAIDDNNQVIHLRFGVASYNSMTQFLLNFYNADAGSIARQGRYDESYINQFLRGAGKLIAYAIAPLFLIPIAIMFFGSAAKFMLNKPSSKFYTLRPVMPTYWSAVQSLVNQIASNQGLVTFFNEKDRPQTIGKEHLDITIAEKNIFTELLPKEFSENGIINVYAISTKSKRLQVEYENKLIDGINAGGDADFFGVVQNTLNGLNVSPPRKETASFEAYFQRYLEKAADLWKFKSADGPVEKDIRSKDNSVTPDPKTATSPPQDPASKTAADAKVEEASADPAANEAKKAADTKKANDQREAIHKKSLETIPKDGLAKNIFENFVANFSDGAEWVSFRVDSTGPVSESFSSSTSESAIAGQLNSLSKKNRTLRFDTIGGKTVADLGDKVLGGLKSFVSGVTDTLSLDGLAAFAGNAFIDIPKHWESSVSSLPKSNYTITLASPYGNPVSQMFNIYVPLAMLLAGALPLATGRQSHTSPFLCELHDRGRMMSRLGIIDSLSITRGTSNLGFNREGKPMAIEVSFSILDLSSIVAMPIGTGLLDGLFDADNAFSDYLMAISGMPLTDVIYRIPMLKRQLATAKANAGTYFSAAHIGQWAASLPPVSLLTAIARGTNRN
jgi:hypothetical protein